MLGFDPAMTGGVGLFEDEPAAPEAPAVQDPPEQAVGDLPSPRNRRNKTRMIGFETSAGDALDLFAPEPAAEEPVLEPSLPVGWAVITAGPGRGTSVTLYSGATSIGAGDGHGIDIGTGSPAAPAITRGTLHHTPIRDAFTLEPGPGAGGLMLNGQAVTGAAEVASGDTIDVGDVRLHLVALSATGFRWTGTEDGTGGPYATQA